MLSCFGLDPNDPVGFGLYCQMLPMGLMVLMVVLLFEEFTYRKCQREGKENDPELYALFAQKSLNFDLGVFPAHEHHHQGQHQQVMPLRIGNPVNRLLF